MAAATLTRMLARDMSVESCVAYAGPECAGCTALDEYIYGVLLALCRRGGALPAPVLRSIASSPVATRELQRVESCREVLEPTAGWADLRHALRQLPPAALLHILDDELTTAEMKEIAEERCKGAVLTRGQLIYAVLLVIATGELGSKVLPVNVQRRIDAAPSCAEWIEKLTASCLTAGLSGGSSAWREFMRILVDRDRPATPAPADVATPAGSGSSGRLGRISSGFDGVRSLFGRGEKLSGDAAGALSGPPSVSAHAARGAARVHARPATRASPPRAPPWPQTRAGPATRRRLRTEALTWPRHRYGCPSSCAPNSPTTSSCYSRS
tara:strand:+ start:76 stop:1053 length:978 start_codon:yes stop_codon:yes gene_type:complete